MNFSLATLRQLSFWQNVEALWERLRIWYGSLPEYLGMYLIAVAFSLIMHFAWVSALFNAYIYTFTTPARLGPLTAYAICTFLATLYAIKNLVVDEDAGEFPMGKYGWPMWLMGYFFLTLIISFTMIAVCIARLLP